MYKNILNNKTFSSLISGIAKQEAVAAESLRRNIEAGTCVIPNNAKRQIQKPCAIGRGTRTKVNVNLGTSTDKSRLDAELRKLELSVALGADTVMDLSLGGNIKKILAAVLKNSPLPVGTVPIYEAAMRAQKRSRTFLELDPDEIFDVLEEQAEAGVDFFTVHCGITTKNVEIFFKTPRILDIVSRGGAILVNWMKKNRRENPLFERFDDILRIAKKYNITLSLGDGMRPGSVLDATDAVQIGELKELGRLCRRARAEGVQVLIEGPGHVPLSQIKKNILLEKKICDGAPFYVLGPLVTDVALGYDHISGAIGGALAAFYGADFLCYLTPAEHIRHPSLEDVREGLIASRIAAHAADIAKGSKTALKWDEELSRARKKRKWARQIELSVDPEKARAYRESSHPHIEDACTMCGEFCSIRLIDNM